METRVLKIGGSLLFLERLRDRINEWLELQAPRATLVVVGGGVLADAVRALDRRHGLPPQSAHEQAIRAMRVNAYLLVQLCTEFNWLARLNDWSMVAQANGLMKRAVLDPVPFMLSDEPRCNGERLPGDWDVTSDSIAARLAHTVGAVELVLLKSALPVSDGKMMCQAAADEGFVDQHFPIVAEGLTCVRAVNIRDREFPEVQLLS